MLLRVVGCIRQRGDVIRVSVDLLTCEVVGSLEGVFCCVVGGIAFEVNNPSGLA